MGGKGPLLASQRGNNGKKGPLLASQRRNNNGGYPPSMPPCVCTTVGICPPYASLCVYNGGYTPFLPPCVYNGGYPSCLPPWVHNGGREPLCLPGCVRVRVNVCYCSPWVCDGVRVNVVNVLLLGPGRAPRGALSAIPVSLLADTLASLDYQL